MIQLIKSALSGIRGDISTKRVILFLLVFTFISEIFLSLFKHLEASPTLRDQLYYFMLTNLGLVFGEPAMESLRMYASKYGPPNIGLPAPEVKP